MKRTIARMIVVRLLPIAVTALTAAWAKRKSDQKQAAQATWGSATDVTKTPTSGSGPAGTGLTS